MPAEPGDFLLRYGLEQLCVIHTASFQAPSPLPAVRLMTVCYWVRAQPSQAIQVIANCGHRHAGEAGWSCFLHGDTLVASLCNEEGAQAAVACRYPDDGRWHRVAACFDTQSVTIVATLDGVPSGWQPSTLRLCPTAPPGGDPGLTVGGYTDMAGGHFDYSFGRSGRGLVDDLRIYARTLTIDAGPGIAKSQRKIRTWLIWNADAVRDVLAPFDSGVRPAKESTS